MQAVDELDAPFRQHVPEDYNSGHVIMDSMPHAIFVLLLAGLTTVAAGDALLPTPIFSVDAVQAGRSEHPRQWFGRTVLVKGVALRSSDTGLLLIDTHIAATFPKDSTTDQVAAMALVLSRVNNSVPFLVLHSTHAARYGHDEKTRIYWVRLRASPCPEKGACDDSVLLRP